MEFKEINFDALEKVAFYYKSNKVKFFSLQGLRKVYGKYYFCVPEDVLFRKMSQKEVTIVNGSKDDIFRGFCIHLRQIIKELVFPIPRAVAIKGLGLKAAYYPEEHALEFKLGYSHKCYIYIDKQIRVQLSQKRDAVFNKSSNKPLLGNFVSKLINLKRANPYTGRGISYKNEKLILKLVKKNRR